MKLLFDQNLSHRLVRALADVYPDCRHVREVGLKAASDTTIWDYAKNNGFTIVSKDADFHQRSFVLGFPPKVIWIRIGNCSTETIERVLRDHTEEVERFDADAAATFLILSRTLGL
jgi:predicted nuclease of predicted toxin-antitoxin system